jgi:hypothetical protein
MSAPGLGFLFEVAVWADEPVHSNGVTHLTHLLVA